MKLFPCPPDNLKNWVKSLSRVQFFMTPWTVAYQVPLSMGFSRQEYWSGLPFPSPGEPPNPGIEPRSPALQSDALRSEPPGKHAKRNSVYFQPRGLSPDLFRMDIQLFHIPWTLGQLITFSEPQFPQKQAELKGSHLWKDIIWHLTPNNYMHITLYSFFVLF